REWALRWAPCRHPLAAHLSSGQRPGRLEPGSPLHDTGPPGDACPKRGQADEVATPDFPSSTQLIEGDGVGCGRRVTVPPAAHVYLGHGNLCHLPHLEHHALIGLVCDQVVEVMDR